MQLGDLGQQSLRIGMLRRFKQGFGGRGFDHSAQIHDHDTVGQMLNHSQVMADEQVGQMQLFAQLVKQVDDLSLDGHIQCRHALITDQEIGFNRQGPGDADALALPARKLVRVAASVGRIQGHLLQQGRDMLALVGARNQAVVDGRLAHNVFDLHARIERGHGVLEDHLQLQPLASGLGVALVGQCLPFIANFAFAGRDHPSDHAAQCGFAATRLAHQSDHFATCNAEGHTVDRSYRLGANIGTQPARHFFDHVRLAHESTRHRIQLQQGRHADTPSGSG